MKRILFSLFLFLVLAGMARAQELQAKLTIQAGKVNTQESRKALQTLQGALNTFLNNRKWSNDTYQAQEKVKCNFLLVIDEEVSKNVFRAFLTVQAARPVYNTAYESPLVNFQDVDLVFRYVEFQPVEFNENRIQGNDPLSANLMAVLAYYCNIILGLDHDSFSPRGGEAFFQKAQFIVNNAPESGEIIGWKAFDGPGNRNRFRLVENLVDSRFTLVHDALYSYYRSGLDQFYTDEEQGRNGILTALSYLGTVSGENPGAMFLPFFFQGKGTELVKVFSRAENEMKIRARDLLVKLDLTNAAAYKELK